MPTIISLSLDSSGAVTGLKQYESETRRAGNALDRLTNRSKKGFSGLTGRVNSASAAMAKAAGIMTAIVGSAAVGAAGYLIKSASALEEVQGKFDVVFKGMGKDAEGWSKTLRKSYGLSEVASKKYLGSMQDILVPMGLARTEAGKMSNKFVQLAVDLGSMNDVGTADVMADIQSATVGNYETMRKYGVVLSAAAIEQEILTTGMANSKKEITNSMKAQATYNLMIKSSQDAIGDYARTQGSFANQLRKAKSNLTDMATSIGQQLLPMATKAITSFNTWIGKQSNFNAVVKTSIGVIQALVNGFNGIRIAAHAAIVVVAEIANFGAAALTTMLDPLSLVLDGLKAIGIVDYNPVKEGLSSLRKFTQDFADSAVQGLGDVYDSSLEISKGFDQAKKKFTETASTITSKTPEVKDSIADIGKAAGKTAGEFDKMASAAKKAADGAKKVKSAGIKKAGSEAGKSKKEMLQLSQATMRAAEQMEQADRAAKRLAASERAGATAAKLHSASLYQVGAAAKTMAKEETKAAVATKKNSHTMSSGFAHTTEGILGAVKALRVMNNLLDEASRVRGASVDSSWNQGARDRQLKSRADRERALYDEFIAKGGNPGDFYGGGSGYQNDMDSRMGRLKDRINRGNPGGSNHGGSSTMTPGGTGGSTVQNVYINQRVSRSDTVNIVADLAREAQRA